MKCKLESVLGRVPVKDFAFMKKEVDAQPFPFQSALNVGTMPEASAALLHP